jgi:bacillithiol biosynthesis cysteine-adding enzyme BshC
VSDRAETASPAPSVRAAIDFERLPWVRPLVRAYTRQFDAVAPLFAGNPADPAAWRNAIARVHMRPPDRARLCESLTRQLTERGAPGEALLAAQALEQPSSVAILTGQQAGAFGGPLYTLLKAVTALQLARRLSDEHGIPATAVFWVDAEDHDWEEVRTAHVLDADLKPRAVELPRLSGAGAQPAGSLLLDDRIEAAIGQLEGALPPTEFRSQALGALRRRYAPGVTLGRAFAGWLDELLGRERLVVFESGDPAAKPLVAGIFARELEYPCRTTRLAREGGSAMSALGHEPQVEPAEDGTALFYLDGAGRRLIRFDGRDYVIGDQRRPPAALREEAAEHPERFSPNVLLRPIVQDRVFPTVCYVGGPSELAYQAQIGRVYPAFEVEVPLLFPRASATLLDSAAARFLDRSGLPLEDLQRQDESALNRLLEQHLPAGLDRALDASAQAIAAEVARIAQPVTALDPTLAGALETTRTRVQGAIKGLHAKIIQAAKRKDETLRRQFARTQALAFPYGEPQERTLNTVFFVSRYSLDIGRRLLDELPLETDRHYVLTL